MGAAAGVVIGALFLVGGVVLARDVRGIGTRLVAFNAYLSAPPWSKNPRPQAARVERRREVFGLGLATVGVLVLIASVASLA